MQQLSVSSKIRKYNLEKQFIQRNIDFYKKAKPNVMIANLLWCTFLSLNNLSLLKKASGENIVALKKLHT